MVMAPPVARAILVVEPAANEGAVVVVKVAARAVAEDLGMGERMAAERVAAAGPLVVKPLVGHRRAAYQPRVPVALMPMARPHAVSVW